MRPAVKTIEVHDVYSKNCIYLNEFLTREHTESQINLEENITDELFLDLVQLFSKFMKYEFR